MNALATWLATATVATALLLPAPALADDGAPLDFSSMSPGSTRTGMVTVSNPSDGPATVALSVQDLRDDDEGCVRPEERAGDTTCGDGGGELSQWLDVTISGEGEILWSGSFTDLLEARQVPGSLAPGDSRDLDISVELPVAAGNDTMTDAVGFDLVIRTVGVTGEDVGEPEVLGAQASTGGHSPHSAHPISLPTLIEAGLVGPVVTAGGVLTGDLPLAVLVVLLALALGLTARVLRSSRRS